MARPLQIVKDDETLDDLLCGDIRILQKRNGYRFSIDPILLANFIDIPNGSSIIDLGTGCGVIPILLAQKSKTISIFGVEVQKDMAEMAKRSVELNNLSGIIRIIHEDINNLRGLFKAESFDIVLSNPPYRKFDSGRINPHSQKAVARHEIMCSLHDILAVSRYLVRPKGKVCLIFPVVRLSDVISELKEAALEPKRLQIVYSNINSEGKLVLIEALKGGKAGLKIQRPLFTHDLTGNPNF